MTVATSAAGDELLNAERDLDRMFANETATPQQLNEALTRMALAHAKPRGSHLQARPVNVGPRTLDSAAVAPTADYMAVGGVCEATHGRVLRVLSTSGTVLASTPLPIGGAGSSTRWPQDSNFVGTVSRGGFVIYSAPDLTLYANLPQEHPSDLAFLSSGPEVVLGCWSEDRIATRVPHDA